jgi:hypothetical protein
MRLTDTLKKAASLVVEFDDSGEVNTPAPGLEPIDVPEPRASAPAKTIEQIVREQPGPNLEDIKVSAPAEPVISSDGHVNYGSIYRMASLPETPFTAEQVLEVLHSLPAELPIESKRATLKVTLSAMAKTTGVTPETVVADASRKLAALASFAQSYTDQANKYILKCQEEIKNLEAEIERRKMGISEATAKQSQMVEACQTESDRLDDVLEFFSLDVPPSKYAKNPA